MTITVSTAVKASVRAAAATAYLTAIDAGSGAGKLRVYTGSKPATPDTAASGTLLAEFPLADPSGVQASGVVTLDCTPTITVTGSASGTPGWWRILDSNNNPIIDGDSSDITVSPNTITSGVDVTLVSGTITQPALS